MFIPDPGSDFFPSRIPDLVSRIRIKEFKYFNPKKTKKWFLSSRKYDPGCSSRIRMLTFYPSRIQGSKKHRIPDPGSGSATLDTVITEHKNKSGSQNEDVICYGIVNCAYFDNTGQNLYDFLPVSAYGSRSVGSMFLGLPDPHLDPFDRVTNPRIQIQIRTKMSRIHNTVRNHKDLFQNAVKKAAYLPGDSGGESTN
jgi:hypothetical protein